MQSLDVSPDYTADEVRRALHAEGGSRQMSYRFEVLDAANRHIGDLDSVVGGKISNNAFANIKRQATLDMLDDSTLDFLSDRVKPYARLTMPDRTRYVPQGVTKTWAERRRNLVPSPAGPGGRTPLASDWRVPGDTLVVDDNGRLVIQATETIDASSLYVDPNLNHSPIAGSTIRSSVEVKTNSAVHAAAMRLTLSTYNGAEVTVGAVSQAIPVGEWVKLTIVATVTAMPAGGYIRSLVWPVSAAYIGDWIRVRNAVVEVARPNATLPDGDFFDGDTAAGRLSRFRWLGTPGQSESVEEVVVGASPAAAIKWVEVRRNIATNPIGPGAPLTTDGWRGSSDTRTAVTVDGQPAIRSTEANVDGSMYIDTSDATYPAVGDTVRVSVEVRADDPAMAAAMRIYWAGYNGGAYERTTPVDQPIPAGQWTRITAEAIVTEAPAGSFFRGLVWPFGFPAVAGASFDIRRAVVQVGRDLGPLVFFDGDSPPLGPLHRRRWLGTPHASASVEEVGTLVDLPPLVIPDTGPGFVEWPLGVFLLESPDRDLAPSGIVSRSVKGHDQLLVLAEDKLERRLELPAGRLYTDAIIDLVEEMGLQVSLIKSTKAMPASMEWEAGTSKLRIINDLLSAINYESSSFDELGRFIGRPYVSPADRAPEYRYESGPRGVIAARGLSQTLDVFGIPNRWVLVVSEADRPPLVATYSNTNPASPTSLPGRGRTITDFRDNEDAADQATLDAKAKRLAFEASQVIERVSFDTLAMPFHSNADVLELDVPRLGLSGTYSEHSWELGLKAGAPMSHTVRRIVTI